MDSTQIPLDYYSSAGSTGPDVLDHATQRFNRKKTALIPGKNRRRARKSQQERALISLYEVGAIRDFQVLQSETYNHESTITLGDHGSESRRAWKKRETA